MNKTIGGAVLFVAGLLLWGIEKFVLNLQTSMSLVIVGTGLGLILGEAL